MKCWSVTLSIHFVKQGHNRLTDGHRGFSFSFSPAFQPPLLPLLILRRHSGRCSSASRSIFIAFFLMAAGTSPLLSMYSLHYLGNIFFIHFSQHFVQFRLKVCILFPMYCLIAFSFSSSYLMVYHCLFHVHLPPYFQIIFISFSATHSLKDLLLYHISCIIPLVSF